MGFAGSVMSSMMVTVLSNSACAQLAALTAAVPEADVLGETCCVPSQVTVAVFVPSYDG